MLYRLYLPLSQWSEYCYYIETSTPFNENQKRLLKYLLCQGFILSTISEKSSLFDPIEFGPRLNFETAWSTNMVSICKAVSLTQVTRLERSRRLIKPSTMDSKTFISQNHDRMTEQVYEEPLRSFETGIKPEPLITIPLLENGPDELKNIGIAAFDDFERTLIYDYFSQQERRNPTLAEILDWANANSEHCRHWLFRARWIIDGIKMPKTLFELVKEPWLVNPGVTLFAFDDNSGAIMGKPSLVLRPSQAGTPSFCKLVKNIIHPTQTAETHNFPTGISPKGGAETGIGGMQRDQRDVRQGAVPIANLSGYGVGNLYLPGLDLPWEDKNQAYLPNLATPLQVLIEGSSGVHRYGNESGIPLTGGFCRSTDITIDGNRWTFQKPILYAAGVGEISGDHTKKNEPQSGMLIVQVGGPAYRIGVGGGAASSKGQGDQDENLDFNAVQRGNAEMSRKVDRVVYACVSLGSDNPIIIAHDQGAGGMANAVKEAVGKAGGRIDIRKVNIGDSTMSVWEIYVAEYQERECFLIWPERIDEFQSICEREKAPCEVLGFISGDGRFVVEDSQDGTIPVNLNLEAVLGELPQKTYRDDHQNIVHSPLDLKKVTVNDALWRVLHLLSVGSKRFLVKNVDRSVKGLTVQQQCCGPLQLTVSDFAISAFSHYSNEGMAYSLGEKSFLMLGDPGAGARMAVAESILNLAGANIGSIQNIGFRANWMWAPKLSGEGAALYDAAKGLSEILIGLGININGGKDSSSMYSKIFNQIVKSPRELVIKSLAVQKEITKKITPDIKKPGSTILLLDLAKGKRRLGGSALAQVYKQLGSEFPDIEDVALLKNGFNFIQSLVAKDCLLSCHDISDGGIITTLLEMAFAGNIAIDLDFWHDQNDDLSCLFAEELGLVFEVDSDHLDTVFNLAIQSKMGEHLYHLGYSKKTYDDRKITIKHKGRTIINNDIDILRTWWEETSYHLDLQRTNPKQANQEWNSIQGHLPGLNYRFTFIPKTTPPEILVKKNKPKMLVLREEGTNGEDEMRSAFDSVGFEVWDVNMKDLLGKKINLDRFRGLASAGGFSYADVPESAKGWAATVRFNDYLKQMFSDFYNRKDTFSLNVCNGAQWAALLGWVPYQNIPDEDQPRFTHNLSGIFESRWTMVKINPSPSIMFKGMVGSILGVWVAHGEGYLNCPNQKIMTYIRKNKLTPLVYVNELGKPTTEYPANPNGSPYGITSLCTPDGRHLAMMPHPERCLQKWQWPYLPINIDKNLEASPWLKMFQNAYDWCLQ